jgi:hypothetical protein
MQGPGQPDQQDTSADPEMMGMQLEQILSQNPQVKEQLIAAAQQVGITPQNADQITQMVMLVLQRPELYPQVRQFAMQAFGLDQNDFPPQLDPEFMMTLAVLAYCVSGELSSPPPPDQSMQQGQSMAGPQPPGSQMQQPPQQGQQPMEQGGQISGPGTGTSDSIMAKVSDGEFVIPADVVKIKGTDFFQKLVNQYHRSPS